MKNKWILINWDGNPSLGLKCYRKQFGKGCVSVGVGEFKAIVYSYGPNSEDSMSSTRWRHGAEISEHDAMDLVDKKNGKAI